MAWGVWTPEGGFWLCPGGIRWLPPWPLPPHLQPYFLFQVVPQHTRAVSNTAQTRGPLTGKKRMKSSATCPERAKGNSWIIPGERRKPCGLENKVQNRRLPSAIGFSEEFDIHIYNTSTAGKAYPGACEQICRWPVFLKQNSFLLDITHLSYSTTDSLKCISY